MLLRPYHREQLVEFLRVKTEIDKTAVKAALDDGQSLAWAALIERRSLRIT